MTQALNPRRTAAVFAALAAAAALFALLAPGPALAQEQAPPRVGVRQIPNSQGPPMEGAAVTALTGPDHDPVAEA